MSSDKVSQQQHFLSYPALHELMVKKVLKKMLNEHKLKKDLFQV